MLWHFGVRRFQGRWTMAGRWPRGVALAVSDREADGASIANGVKVVGCAGPVLMILVGEYSATDCGLESQRRWTASRNFWSLGVMASPMVHRAKSLFSLFVLVKRRAHSGGFVKVERRCLIALFLIWKWSSVGWSGLLELWTKLIWGRFRSKPFKVGGWVIFFDASG